jgi:hypothetical protein
MPLGLIGRIVRFRVTEQLELANGRRKGKPPAGPPKASKSLPHSTKLFPVSIFTFSSDTTFSDRSATFTVDSPSRRFQRGWAEP